MKKRISKWTRQAEKTSWPGVVVLSALFLCGAVVGFMMAFGAHGESTLYVTLQEYRSAVMGQTGVFNLLGRALFNAFKYHAAVFLLGFTMLGVCLSPLITAAKGFFLSFSIGVFVKAFGLYGFWFALAVFGAQALVTLPCLFFLSLRSMSASATLWRAVSGKPKKWESSIGAAYLRPFAICSIILGATALFETFVTPIFLRWLAG